MPVTITACGNATPPGGRQIATVTVASQDYQEFILTDSSGSALGQSGASPIYVSVPTRVSASISNTACVIATSGSVVVTNTISASISSGSVALLAGANMIGTACAVMSGAWGVSASVVNSPSVVVVSAAASLESISNRVVRPKRYATSAAEGVAMFRTFRYSRVVRRAEPQVLSRREPANPIPRIG